MFDLTLTPEQEAVVAGVRAHSEELRALARSSESERKPSTEVVDRLLAGQYAVPTQDGTIDPLTVLVAAQEYGYGDPGIGAEIVNSWLPRLLGVDADGSPAQLTSTLLFEGYGRAPSEYRTTATPSSDGWLLSGNKESVFHPGAADRAIVAAVDQAGGLGLFVLSGSPAGYVVERDDAAEGKLGLRSAHTGAVRLDGVTVAGEARIDTPDQLTLQRRVALARLAFAAVALGSAKASIDYATGWAKERVAFGKVIASFQGVAFVIADLTIAYESARLLLWDTITTLPGRDDIAAIEGAVGRAVARANAIANDAGRQGVNLLGVHGIVTDHPVERWYRGSAALSTFDFDPLAAALDVA